MQASKKSILSQSVILLLITAAVFTCWWVLFPFHLWEKEANGFFSLTTDYGRWAFSMPAPASVIMGDFLTQFFQYPIIGAFIQALSALIVAGSILLLFHRFRLPAWLNWLPAVAAIAICILQFNEELLDKTLPYMWMSLSLAIFVYLPIRWFGLIVPFIIYFFLPLNTFRLWMVLAIILEVLIRRKLSFKTVKADKYFLSLILTVCILGGGLYWISQNADFKKAERLGHIQCLAYNNEWNELSELIADPNDYENLEVPYILLAMSHQGQLGSRIFNYPINSEEYFLYIGMGTRDAYFFNQLYYEHVGMLNEAIHMAYQEKTRTRYPMSFRILKNLIRFEQERGDYIQVNKYLDLLGQATCYKSWVKEHRPTAEQLAETDTKQNTHRYFITNATLSNLYYEVQAGNTNQALNEYYLCALMIRKNMLAFTKHLNEHPELLKGNIPTHFWEAIVLADAIGFPVNGIAINPELHDRFMQFEHCLGAQDKRTILMNYKYTFWYNYYFLTFPEDKSGNKGIIREEQYK